jgi:dipeptidase E
MFYLIGGKDDDLKSNLIETELLKLTNKYCPKMLYFATAMKDNQRSINHFISTFDKLNVKITIAKLNEIIFEELNNLFNESDIIYIGGGNTDYLRNEFIKYNVDKLLMKYHNTDKIFAGISAGAILYTNSGMGDSYSYQSGGNIYNFKMVDGLNLINLKFCPHYQKDDLYIFNDIGLSSKLALALEDDTAVVIDKNILKVYKANKKHSVYLFKDNKMTPIYPNITYSI